MNLNGADTEPGETPVSPPLPLGQRPGDGHHQEFDELAASITGPTQGVPGLPLVFTLGGANGAVPPNTRLTYRINWGDATRPQVVTGGGTIEVAHT